MAEFTLHLPRKASKCEDIITEDRRTQSCATRTSYAYIKKNNLHPTANEMISGGSAVQNLLEERNSTSGLNYWLK